MNFACHIPLCIGYSLKGIPNTQHEAPFVMFREPLLHLEAKRMSLSIANGTVDKELLLFQQLSHPEFRTCFGCHEKYQLYST